MASRHGKKKEPINRLLFFGGMVAGITANWLFLLAVVLLDKM